MRRRWRHFAICAVIAVVSAVTARLLSELRFFELLNLKSLDLQFVLRGKRPVSEIVLITADDKALKSFPELRILWHPYYAQAIHAAAAAGAKVIGLDLAFGASVEKYEPGYDQLMAEAVLTSPVPVVVGYVPPANTNQRTDPIPVNIAAAALGLAGYANLTTDDDEFVRRQELIENAPSNAARSLAMRVVEKFLGTDLEVSGDHVTLAGREVPGRTIYINYAGPPRTFPRISLADVVAAAQSGDTAQLHSLMNGKIVLIGSDTFDDRYASPFYTLHAGLLYTTAGVEIHANTIHTLLDRSYLMNVSGAARMAALLVAAGITALIAITTAAGAASTWLVLEAIGLIAATQILFRAGWILSFSETLVAVTLCLIAAIVYRFATAEQRGNLFRRAISLFVGKEVAAVLDDTQTIRLSGVRQTVTIMFTDIRGFTAFTERVSEEQGPEIVVKMLNEYMGAMTALIVAHHGQVNKFLGDGILAVFSDSDEGAVPGDHARRAVECATAMVKAPARFETGAGIHTGTAVVGNVGSADKMEYTVLGDTVNLASRIESLNKEYKTSLLMSGATQSLLGASIATTYLTAAPVKGKAAPIPIYTVTELTPVHV
jgi:adenylate cyclase